MQAFHFVLSRHLRDVDPMILLFYDPLVIFTTTENVLYFFLHFEIAQMSVPLGIVVALCLGSSLASPPPLASVPLMLLAGAFGMAGVALVITALRFEPAGSGSVLKLTSDVLLAFLLQLTWFEQVKNV